MADEKSKSDKPLEGSSKGEEASVDLDLDEDVAAALGEAEQDGKAAGADVDNLLKAADPNFEKEISDISAKDFEGVIIEKDRVSEEVSHDDSEKAPSLLKTYYQNLPTDLKRRYFAALTVIAVMLPIALLVYKGILLPRFELPYVVSLNEMTSEVFSYSTDEPQVPLFDQFRNSSFTVALPRTLINLKQDGGSPAYGEFEFFLNLREKELEKIISSRESEIMDLVQRTLEQVTWKELQTPLGKEKVKKAIRFRVNEFLQGNLVIGVYYRSVILSK